MCCFCSSKPRMAALMISGVSSCVGICITPTSVGSVLRDYCMRTTSGESPVSFDLVVASWYSTNAGSNSWKRLGFDVPSIHRHRPKKENHDDTNADHPDPRR